MYFMIEVQISCPRHIAILKDWKCTIVKSLRAGGAQGPDRGQPPSTAGGCLLAVLLFPMCSITRVPLGVTVELIGR